MIQKGWRLFAADSASGKSLESTQHRYKLGTVSYYDLLIAQQQRLQTELDLTKVQAKRLVNTVVFCQAMGGGLNGITEYTGRVAEDQSAESVASR
mgnify:CR=1 FL=1